MAKEDKKQPRLMGKLEAYVPGESFEDYLELVENYFELNELKDEKFKVLLLINMIGSAASSKVIKAFKPRCYKDAKYNDVVKMCKKLFIGDKSIVVERYKFNSRLQKQGEEITDYAVELQAAAENCEFGNFLDAALRDRFVAGLIDLDIKQNLLKLSETKTFNEFVDAALREALVVREAKTMSANAKDVSVHQVSRGRNYSRAPKTRGNQQDLSSWRGQPNKDANVRCYRCQALGHYSRDCDGIKRKPYDNRGHNQGNWRRAKTENYVNTLADGFGQLELDSALESDHKSVVAQVNHLTYGDPNSFLGKINSVKLALINVHIESVEVLMELDTGSCVSVCGQSDYEKNFRHLPLMKCDMPLSVVSGESLRVIGLVKVRVKRQMGDRRLNLLVIDSKKKFIPLMGRDWIDALFPKWRNNFALNSIQNREDNGQKEKAVNEIKLQYAKLFDNDMSKPIKGFTVDIRMNENAQPFVHKAYTIPFNIRDRVEEQLGELVKQGILEKVEYANWASPMVVVAKTNKELRICLDGSVTINPHIETHHYPLPVIDELLAGKSDGKLFCVMDLKGAYQQLIVSDATKKLLTVNTFKGLYAYKRLPFGVKPAASIFQSVMDKIIEGLEGVQVYIDDLLVWGRDLREVYNRVRSVLDRLLQFNVKVNLAKCQWFVDRVRYLGHDVSAAGISPNLEKLRAISEAPRPQNVTQLKSFLGMVMFYSKFWPRLNVSLAPLYKLLKKDSEWNWDNECKNAFENCKRDVCSDRILVHYDPKLPIIVTCDASNDGIAGVLSHAINGQERPVFFVSRTLTSAEKNYPILHREALAIVFAMEKFYKYVYGHHVKIVSDHKPLEGIFMSKKGEPPIVASRLQRYILRLSIFDYELHHKKGSDIGHADFLSRLPIEGKLSEVDEAEQHHFMIKALSIRQPDLIDLRKIREETDKDVVLKEVRECVLNGWRNDKVKKNLMNYFAKNSDLNVEHGCLMYGSRVVIPHLLRKLTLKILHANHAGILRMKQNARELVYWEGMNEEIELFVKSCEACQVLRKDKPDKVYGKWAEATFPMERVHVDFFHFGGQTFFIFIDAYSRWIEIRRMKRTNAPCLIQVLVELFGIFGFPVELVCDNGPPFNSYEFRKACEGRKVKLTHSPPYNPESNGLVERAVQTTKSVLRKFVNESRDSFQIDRAVEKFLFNHRNLPCTESLIVPSHLMFSYKPRCPITLINEVSKEEVDEKRICEKPIIEFKRKLNNRNHVISKNEKPDEVKEKNVLSFKIKENVLYLSKLKGYCYATKAEILKQLSRHIYMIKVEGIIKKAHINQLRKSVLKKTLYNSDPIEIVNDPVETPETIVIEDSDISIVELSESPTSSPNGEVSVTPLRVTRQSKRNKKRTSRYQ